MDIRHLRYFVVVAEELNFTRAAERLRISQPPLSTQIKDLEDELGTDLFLRTKRSVELTRAGQRFLLEARAILDHMEKAKRVAQSEEDIAGTLSIASIPSVEIHILPKLLEQFHQKRPGVEFCLRSLNYDDQLKGLREETIDCAFLRLPVEDYSHRSIRVEEILEENLVLAISNRSPLAESGISSIKECREASFILWHRHIAPRVYDEIMGVLEELQGVPRISNETDSLQLALGLAAANLGIAIVPNSARVLCREGVTYINTGETFSGLKLGIAWKKNIQNPLVEEFIETTRAIDLKADLD